MEDFFLIKPNGNTFLGKTLEDKTKGFVYKFSQVKMMYHNLSDIKVLKDTGRLTSRRRGRGDPTDARETTHSGEIHKMGSLNSKRIEGFGYELNTQNNSCYIVS